LQGGGSRETQGETGRNSFCDELTLRIFAQ
jgi:hypothetical protein